MIHNGAIHREIRDKTISWHCTICDRRGRPMPIRAGSIQITLEQAARLGDAHYLRMHTQELMRV